MQYPGGTSDERALVVAAQRGGLSACAQLTARHQTDLLRLAFLWTGDQARAVALAEQTLARTLLELPRFDPDLAFRPWLLQHLAVEATQRPPLGQQGGAPALFASGAGRFQVEDERSRLTTALQRLDVTDRIALLLHDVGNLDLVLLASALGKRPEAIRAAIEPARRRLLTSVDLPDERALRAALNDAAVDAPRADLWPGLEPEVTLRLAREHTRSRLLTAAVGGGVLLLLAGLGLFIFGDALRGNGDDASAGAAVAPDVVETPSAPTAPPTPITLPPPADVPDRLLLAIPAALDDWSAWDYALLDPASGGAEPLLDHARYLTISPDGGQLFFVRRAAPLAFEAVAVDPLGNVLWRAPLSDLTLDEVAEVEPRALFVSNLVIVAIGRSGGADVLVFDRMTGRPSLTWRYPLPNGDDAAVAEVALAPGRLDTMLQIVVSTSRREAIIVEVELPTFEIYREQLVPLETAGDPPLWVSLVSTNLGISAGPLATAQTPNGELRYAVAPYARAVTIVDSERSELAGQYALDISAVAPPGLPPAELRGSALTWPAGQLSPDGRTLYIGGPLRATPDGLTPTIWEIDVATWAVRRELALGEPGRITALALSDAGATLYVGFQAQGASQPTLFLTQPGAPAATLEQLTGPLDVGYSVLGSLADLYQTQHGRAPSVGGAVYSEAPAFEGLPRAVLAIEPTSAWPADEVTVRLTFLAPSGETLTPAEPGVRFDPATGVTVQLSVGAARQLMVLGREAHGVFSARVRLEEPGIWDAVATVSAADVTHWTIEQPGALVVRSGLRGSDGMTYWPAVSTQPDPLFAGSTGWLTLRFVDLINGALLPTGVTFEQGAPVSIRLTFIDDGGAVIYETLLLRAGPGLYTGLIATPAEGRYRLRAELSYPDGGSETIDHGFLTISPAR